MVKVKKMKQYFEYYYHKYPKSTIQDYFKLLKQMCLGPKHIIKSEIESLKNLVNEVKNLNLYSDKEDLYEYIGSDFVRVNLRPYVKLGLDLKWLNSAFCTSAFSKKETNILDTLNELAAFLKEVFPNESVNEEVEKYQKDGFPTLNHSETYRKAYQPSYRVIESKFIDSDLKVLQIQNFLNHLSQKNLTIIAIDGPAGSGKSTISEELEKRGDYTVIHVDDFFDGSNKNIGINSRRIIEEILNCLKPGEPLEYRSFDCTNREFVKKRIEEVKNTVILEGVYSANSLLKPFYSAIIYMYIYDEEQLERLKKRSPRLFPRFLNEWLPREKEYFQKENIYASSDLIV